MVELGPMPQPLQNKNKSSWAQKYEKHEQRVRKFQELLQKT